MRSPVLVAETLDCVVYQTATSLLKKLLSPSVLIDNDDTVFHYERITLGSLQDNREM